MMKSRQPTMTGRKRRITWQAEGIEQTTNKQAVDGRAKALPTVTDNDRSISTCAARVYVLV